jgi:release factor glutamine methyltransferase
MSSLQTIREAYLQASSFFISHQIEDAEYCAELLLRYLLGWDRSRFFLEWNTPLTSEQYSQWEHIIERRVNGEPAQYIIGQQEFYGLTLTVNPAVLIPRPETELLVEQILERTKTWQQSVRVVDVGTGSGAIAIALAVHRPEWTIIAVDISTEALEVAKLNARQCGVLERIKFIYGYGLVQHQSGLISESVIDIVVSNPPYIPSAEIADLQREVRANEPHTALDGGADGLEIYRKIIEQMVQLPQMPKLVAFETGFGQTQDVASILAKCYGDYTLDILLDLAGRDRMVFATIEDSKL